MIGERVTDTQGSSFEILKEIGRGGFGVVYLVQDDAETEFAMKMLGPIHDATVQETFEREINAATAVDHPNVLRVLSQGQYDRQPGEVYLFAVTEYCPDGNYRETLAGYVEKQFLIDIIRPDFDQILSGIEALHTIVIHRDLKPENVLRVGTGLKVGDFGLSKFVDEATRTLTFKGGGTPRYMAPETWERQRAVPATDLYAIGVMLFEAVTGRPPFDADDFIALRKLHLYQPAPRAKKLNPSIPDRLDGIIRKLLEKDSAKRYQTSREVSEALGAIEQNPKGGDVADIVGKIRRHYDAEDEKLREAELAASLEKDKQARIEYMEQQLIALIDDVVEEINDELEEVKIIRQNQGKDTVYRLGDRSLQVNFFNPGEMFRDPLVPGRMATLENRHVVHGGYLEIREHGQDREGWNMVLVQPPDNPYGEWIIVETEVSPLTGRTTHFKPTATEAQLFADNLACHWMPAMHSFQLKDRPLERTDILQILGKFVP